MSHDSREIFVQASHDCETFTRVSYDSREILVRAAHDSRETFVRMSHDVRVNFNQSYFSQLSLEMVLFMLHICPIVQIAETFLRCVCKRLQRVGDGFATYAMTWQRFCDDFCRTKKYYMFKTLANSVDRITDRTDMTSAVECGRKALTQTIKHNYIMFSLAN